MQPLVSILIPAYQAGDWVAESIRSALGQSWPKKEIIVVDDGSRDDTLRVARSFECATCKVLSQENRGASAARNAALALAQGDYIQWLDADNLLASDKIARQLAPPEVLERPALLLSSPWGYFRYRWQRAHFKATPLWVDLPVTEWICRKLAGNVFMIPESWLVSRQLTEGAGRWNEALSLDDDGEYFIRVVSVSEGVHFVNGARSYYRCANPASLSSMVQRPQAKLESQFASLCAQMEVLLSFGKSERSTAACLRYLQDALIYFYPDSPELVQRCEELARGLGGSLAMPKLSWKYAWIAQLFGWGAAKHVSFTLPALKSAAQGHLDRVLYRMQPDRSALP